MRPHLIDIEVDPEDYYEKFKFFIENINDLIYVVDPSKNFAINFINTQIHNNLLGYVENDLINTPLLDLIHPEDIKKMKKALKKGHDGADKLEEGRIKDGYGYYIWFEFKIKKFKNSINKNRILIIAKKITEKKDLEEKIREHETKLKNLMNSLPEIRFWKLFYPKKYEEALRVSYEMLQKVIENIPENIFWKDENLVYLGCNQNYSTLIKADNPENIIGKTDQNLFSDKDYVDQLRKRELNVMNSNRPEYHIVESRTLSDGKDIWLEINRIPLHNSEGNIVGLLVTYDDITERKKAEKQLKESEEKFRKVFETIPDLYFLVTDDSTILDYKAERKDLYLPPNKFIGKKLIVLFPKQLRERALNAIRTTIINEKATIVEYRFLINNEVRYFEARHLYFSSDRVAIFVRDITERKRAEILIKKELKKLKDLEQIRKDLISRFSHELKTPLVPLINGAELLMTVYKDQIRSDEAIEIIELINKGGMRLDELINKLLEVSRIEAEKLTLTIENVDLSKLVKVCSKDMKYLLEKRKLSLTLNIPEKFYINIDKVRIKEVIDNLLSNAIKNSPPNAKITIGLKKDEKWASLTVSDTGVGFTEKEMEFLFTRFGKIDRDSEGLEYLDIQGSGLGLFISKNIIEMHKGQIWLESAGRNKGSKFIINLPINYKELKI